MGEYLLNGVFVAILGPDGVGKSTVIQALQVCLDDSGISVRAAHLRPGLLPSLGMLWGGARPQGPVTDPHKAEPSGTFGSMIRLAWLWLDYVFGYWAVVRPHVKRTSGVFIFDRYVYDVRIDPRRFRVALPTWILNAMVRSVPQPDLVVCLRGDARRLLARKGELPLAEIERQLQVLSSLVGTLPNAITVSTDTTIEETHRRVSEAVLQSRIKRARS